ncbi:MAG: recombinase family protein [Patescibacteria group bacterium]
MSNQKYFLYARKSTDVEDKQVLSIEAQIVELRAFAKKEGLQILDELVEKKSAKVPGRQIFNSMMDSIEKGEAQGIVSWHPDRLARNSVDGGRIIYLLDTGQLAALKFPQFWFESTPQGKFMLNIAFGQSKYYVDSLSENVKRGLRQKARRGEFSGIAPIGYINDLRSKTVVVDKEQAKVVRQAFELYAEGNSTLDDISRFLARHGIKSRNGIAKKRDRISFILSNPFYIGLFSYAGELYKGKHQPVISKKIFDKVQEVLQQKSRPHHKTKNEPQPYCGLLRCGTCNFMITGESKTKHQKNGNEHHYVYYRCTKKSKVMKCNEPCIRQKALDEQIAPILQKFSLRSDWADDLLNRLEQDTSSSARSSVAFVQETENTIKAIQTKLQRLLDSYLEQDIDRETYVEKKAALLGEKKTLREKITQLEQKRIGWVEPMRKWINTAAELPKIARESDLSAKKVAAKEIFGSNLVLSFGKVRPVLNFRPQRHWFALPSAREKIRENSESCVLVPPPGFEPGLPH